MVETLYRHKKRGTIYRILHEGLFQTAIVTDDRDFYALNDLDQEPAIVYQDVNDPTKIWVRMKKEFFDGRFEEVN